MKKNLLILSLMLIWTIPSVHVSAQEKQDTNKVVIQPSKDLKVDGDIFLPYQTMKKVRTTGNISVVDANESLESDARLDFGAHLNGKVPGAFGNFDFHGLGRAITVVDGVIRDGSYLDMNEIEQITVLKDAYSRMLYGADGDAAVILITTKSGTKSKKVLKFNFEQGLQSAISMPEFLDAATYMETFNKAYKNDGNINLFYRQGVIDSTRNNYDPVLYPNSAYWGSEFVNNTTNFTNFYSEASGGNDKVQYFMNLGWKRNKGWLALPEKDGSNKLNLRGKVDFEVTNWLKMKTDVVAIFDFYSGPQSSTFYEDASKLLPNSFPLLIPMDRVLNLSSLPGLNPVGESLLGGTSVYQQNLYGDMIRGGERSDINRLLQYNVGFDINLEKLTKGLKLSGLFNMDFFNYYSQFIDNNYAVYAVGKPDVDGNFNLTKIGVDKFTTQQTVNDDFTSFRRSTNAYLTANYDRIFGKHQVSVVALGYYKQLVENEVVQDLKRLRFGAQANYTYDNKYILEAGLLSEGSNKLNPDSRFKTVPSFGAAWVLSNEGFLQNNSVVDYLKLRGSYGEIVNDNWTLGDYNGYFLYEPNYARTGTYNYNNALNSNSIVTMQSLGNVYSFQSRKEFVTGFDAYLLKRKLWIESSYWNSISSGNMVSLESNTPSTMGIIPVGNFNSTRYQGVELGLVYNEQFGDIKIKLGVNYLYSVSDITKWEEPVYSDENKHLSRVGTSGSSMWGLTSLGLYSTADFKTDGTTLVDGLPKPSYGVVRPGDIKYKNINGDQIINSDDQTVLGLNGNNQQISLNVDLNYKNWQLFVLGTGSWGGNGYTNSDYYWFKGNEAKYSEVALKAFDPDSPNPNAEYPRLSLTSGSNNYINSTYWMYERSYFELSALQVSYNFDLGPQKALNSLKIYARGSNLLSYGKDIDIMQLNWNSAPQSRVFAFGLVANF